MEYQVALKAAIIESSRLTQHSPAHILQHKVKPIERAEESGEAQCAVMLLQRTAVTFMGVSEMEASCKSPPSTQDSRAVSNLGDKPHTT